MRIKKRPAGLQTGQFKNDHCRKEAHRGRSRTQRGWKIEDGAFCQRVRPFPMARERRRSGIALSTSVSNTSVVSQRWRATALQDAGAFATSPLSRVASWSTPATRRGERESPLPGEEDLGDPHFTLNPIGANGVPSARRKALGPKFTVTVTPLAKAVCWTLWSGVRNR